MCIREQTLGYTNTASVTSSTPDPTPTNNTGTSTVVVDPRADVATTIQLPASATAGSVVTATIIWTNNGTSTAANVTGSVVIGTAGGVITTASFNTLTLAVGASVSQTVTFTVPGTAGSRPHTNNTTPGKPLENGLIPWDPNSQASGAAKHIQPSYQDETHVPRRKTLDKLNFPSYLSLIHISEPTRPY